jgi:tetratricopeptide (TPR) repeat protein
LSSIRDLLQAARECQRRSDFAGMAAAVDRALALEPERPDAQLMRIEALIYRGKIDRALEGLAAIRGLESRDARVWNQLLQFYQQLGQNEAAFACARVLHELRPDSPDALLALASAATIVNELQLAQELLERIIAMDPGQAEAHYARSTLQRQTESANHVEDLQRQLNALPAGSPAEVALCYALGKEYEDLGRYDESFEHYRRGAAARKARLSYQVERDVETMAEIGNTFDAGWKSARATGADVAGPVFVLGLPRSGTTLVDRILDAHPQVSSLGEVNDFAYAVMRHGGPAANKSELMRGVARADLAELGESYWQALRGYGKPGPVLVDKTPGNYLYLGLILQALPGARIVHVQRHPVASGYAMYKALFRMGYPFSYDLEQIARYCGAYQRLMDHWRRTWPHRILDVRYERLVDEQSAVTAEILEYCGLPWSDACLAFHRHASTTATASALQVRKPIYRDARDLWRQ